MSLDIGMSMKSSCRCYGLQMEERMYGCIRRIYGAGRQVICMKMEEMQLRNPTNHSGAGARLTERGALQTCYRDNTDGIRNTRQRTYDASHA